MIFNINFIVLDLKVSSGIFNNIQIFKFEIKYFDVSRYS